MKTALALTGLLLGLVTARAEATNHLIVTLVSTNQPGADGAFSIGGGNLALRGTNVTYQIETLYGYWSGAFLVPAPLGAGGTAVIDLGEPFICGVPNPPDAGGCLYLGSFAVSSQQAAELLRGQWLLVINRALDPAEEYRGQILLDNDQDRVPDFRDACLGTPSGALVNADGCSIEQLCPCDGPWGNHAEFVNCMKRVTREFFNAGLIPESERRERVRAATRSDCGKRR